MEDGFNITREDVMFNYVPSSNVISYSYRINDESEVQKNGDEGISLNFNKQGKYTIVITNTLEDGSFDIKTYRYLIDKEAPILKLKDKTYVINQNENVNINVNAFDNYDGDISNRIVTNMDEIDFSESGVKKINVSVSDSAGNSSSDIIFVTVKSHNTSILYIGWFVFILFLVLLINFLYKFIKSAKYEKRFSKYTLNNEVKSISLLDSLSNKYNGIVNKYSGYLNNSGIFSKMALRYEKYDVNGFNFIMRKILLGMIFSIVYILLCLLKFRVLNALELIIPFILGYYTLDIIYIIKYKKYRKQIKNDLLKAVTLLNNAFKAGKSIEQAIETVSVELDGPIAKEFKCIHKELSYGMDLDVSFRRFRDRIKLDEASYLSASISVVNLTGGNIIKVFDSIEKTLYSKKKLNEELNALTSSSRFIMYVLIFVPIIFIFTISIINKDYFLPMLSNPLGILLLIVEIVIYVVYIFVVRKIMKVR